LNVPERWTSSRVYALTGYSDAAMLLLQAALGGFTAALTAWLAARIFSRAAGMIAGALVAFDPALIVYAAELHSLTLDALANVALVCASIALPGRPGARKLGGVGMLFGLSALTRATALALVPMHLLWLRRYRALVTFGPALALVAAAIVVYAPWPVRNTLLLGQPTLGSSESAEWLWRGNNPEATGGSLTPDGERMLDLAPPDFRAHVEAADEAQRMTIYRDAALIYMTSDPADAIKLYLDKLVAFWWGDESTGELYPDLWLTAYRVWYLAICGAAVIGVWRSVARTNERPSVLLLLATLAIISLTQAMFYVEGRHRIGVEPLILVLSGPGLAWLTSLLLTRSRTAPQVLAGAAELSGARDQA
jgi:4-amino-4-deoxy-L-arabinose transferase-like glycosyltransferase